MLMKTHYMDVILFGYFDDFIDIILIDSEFAERTSSDDMMRLTSSYFGINSYKNFLSFEFIFEVFKCFQSTYI